MICYLHGLIVTALGGLFFNILCTRSRKRQRVADLWRRPDTVLRFERVRIKVGIYWLMFILWRLLDNRAAFGHIVRPGNVLGVVRRSPKTLIRDGSGQQRLSEYYRRIGEFYRSMGCAKMKLTAF